MKKKNKKTQRSDDKKHLQLHGISPVSHSHAKASSGQRLIFLNIIKLGPEAASDWLKLAIKHMSVIDAATVNVIRFSLIFY